MYWKPIGLIGWLHDFREMLPSWLSDFRPGTARALIGSRIIVPHWLTTPRPDERSLRLVSL